MFPIKILIQNCLHLIKALIFYIWQLELKKLVKNCGFSPFNILQIVFFIKTCKNDSNTLYSELSETQNYAYWYARFFPGTHDFR